MLKALKKWLMKITHRDVDSIVAGFQASRDQLVNLIANNADAMVDLEVEAYRIREEKIANSRESERASRVATKIEELLV